VLIEMVGIFSGIKYLGLGKVRHFRWGSFSLANYFLKKKAKED